jgi:predicted glycogen debranching enzyme
VIEPAALAREWLEADGLGGFASGAVSGIRTRRYHALLVAALAPPTERTVMVSGFDAYAVTPAGRFAISSQRYLPGVISPDGATRLVDFAWEPWPRWRYRLEDGTVIEQELFVTHGAPRAVVRWRAVGSGGGAPAVLRLEVRPLLCGRDYHALHRENPALAFDAAIAGERVTWQPYAALPAIASRSNGRYRHEPYWYRGFTYAEEVARGLDHVEDLAAPGVLEFDLAAGDGVWIVSIAGAGARAGASAAAAEAEPARPAIELAEAYAAAERARRARFATPLHRAADAYLVRRGAGHTIVAGYPWFTDWGRDTFIAMRGLCLATGRLDEALGILREWAGAVSEGMLPNRFVDRGAAPEYNAADASLWYVIAAGELFDAAARAGRPIEERDRRALEGAIDAILDGHAAGTRYGIHLDKDGLLAAGAPGVQLTWMDAKVGDRVITPRAGKPVEIEALWLNALAIGARREPRWRAILERGAASFQARFWDPDRGYLSDVIDVDGEPGRIDPALRPNQILAVGGLPAVLLDEARARRVVDVVEARLWTPLGLRTLAPGEPGYVARYEGGVPERDGAYHQGAAWPWLLGPFVEAWLRVHGRRARAQARARFLAPLFAYAAEIGHGHICELTDAEPPHAPRGCPFQAWSVGEALRLALDVLADAPAPAPGGESGGEPGGENDGS